MGRLTDLYLWSQAIKVFCFISWALLIVVVERLTRLLLTVVSWLVPEFVLEWVALKWQRHVTPLSRSMLLKRSSSFQAKLAAGDMDAAAIAEAAEAHAELFYDTPQLITKRGYPFEQHYVETVDGFILGLHRIPHGKFNALAPGSPQRPVVYLMHGFLQSSEAWVAARTSLAFQLAEGGFDVWLGNARGNKYSAGHNSLRPDQDAYWNFTIDDVAAKDLPAALTYVTRFTRQKQLAYVGFSQGTAVAFACFSTRFDIAALVHSFIALAPATTAKGFSQPLLDSIAKLSPDFVFFLLGRQALFGSAFLFWQNLLTNAQLVRVIDWFILHMFSWSTRKIAASDKPVLYAHIYSMSSVKSVVHWFQIMKAQKFQRYQEWTAAGHPVVFVNEHENETATGTADAAVLPTPPSPKQQLQQLSMPPSASAEGHSVPACPSPFLAPPFFSHPSSHVYRSRVAQEYPLRQISIPVLHVLWGSADHLPDTQWLLQNLPAQATSQGFEGFEHMDFLYAAEAKHTVWPDVVARCKKGAERAAAAQAAASGLPLGSSSAGLAASASCSSSSESDSSLALFRTAVLTRDNHGCVRCGDAASANALHVVSLLPRSEPDWVARGQLLHGYETVNGLTLCSACLPAFEAQQWGFSESAFTASEESADLRCAIVDAAGAHHTLLLPERSALMQHWPTVDVIAAHIKWSQQQKQQQREGGGREQHAYDSALENGMSCAVGVQKRANGSARKANARS